MPRTRDIDRDGSKSECCEHLAIVTSPVQCWQNLYTPCEALSAGTLFKDLYLPLVGCGNACATPYRKGGAV
ncbi:MAG: spore coat associated protein CotJA [Clostridia bacterium]|nr:spore coat associated protein CotJA [Clostridia bacterium]